MAKTVVSSEKIRIRLKAYDHVVLDRNNLAFSTQTQRFKRTI